MTDFVSQVKVVAAPQRAVYETVSDLSHLEALKDRLPADKLRSLEATPDRVEADVNMPGLGCVSVVVADREPFKTVKLQSEKSPISFTLWIQLKEKTMVDCYMKITLRADVPFLMKGMISKPLQEGVDKIAEALASIPY